MSLDQTIAAQWGRLCAAILRFLSRPLPDPWTYALLGAIFVVAVALGLPCGYLVARWLGYSNPPWLTPLGICGVTLWFSLLMDLFSRPLGLPDDPLPFWQLRLWKRDERARREEARQEEVRREHARKEEIRREEERKEELRREEARKEQARQKKAQQEKAQKEQSRKARGQGAHDERASTLKTARTSQHSWWVVLDVSPDAAYPEVQAAYRKKMRQYHPDVVNSLGPDFVAAAETRAREINLAFEQARKHFKR